MAKKTKKLTRQQLAEMLAAAMNLLNDLNSCQLGKTCDGDSSGWSSRQLGEWHGLALKMPEEADFANNGLVDAKHF